MIARLYSSGFVEISQGIPLQISDIFIEELNKADGQEISNESLIQLLDPFLKVLATSNNFIIKERIMDHIFNPLMENNTTPTYTEWLETKPEQKPWIDGGKLSISTKKEVLEVINQKFSFPNFNILLFAQEKILEYASGDSTLEINRDTLYDLYNKALNLEPKPDKPELTFSQRMLLNRTQSFFTKKMEKRQRVQKQKKTKKLLYNVGSYISSQIFSADQQQDYEYSQDELEQELLDLQNDPEILFFDQRRKALQ